MAEAAVIASGQSYNGQDPVTKEHRFDKLSSVEILSVEFGVFIPLVTERWNCMGHLWLKRYIYFRMNRHINRDLALYLTYMISAFWHGFYPSYFIVFILYALYTETQKDLYKICCKYPKLGSIPGLIICYILSYLGIAHLGAMFTILLLYDIAELIKAIYWIPIFYIVIFAFLKLTRISI